MYKKQIDTGGSYFGAVSLAYMYGMRVPTSVRKELAEKARQEQYQRQR